MIYTGTTIQILVYFIVLDLGYWYKSNLSHMIRDISFCLLDLFGFTQQKNTNSFNLGKSFNVPITTQDRIKINNNNIQIYQAIFGSANVVFHVLVNILYNHVSLLFSLLFRYANFASKKLFTLTSTDR